ncbi:Holliday junction branch migration protein RuvA [Sandaracinobacteroides hominis]|uniref:Holliday junction branch migration protein RuvA n=1 Tax=Sandaracinobacteroides hominis TaxID=2780086 RepID=UPI0018F5BB2B|nr:Holliday junction branch migration protein RuvA [Sandaracinobacteroides hominis]
MIASLKGFAQHVGADHVVIEVAGVGYLVQVSARIADRLRAQPIGDVNIGDIAAGRPQPVFLFIETQVREDSITLFGFLTAAEREWFRKLTSVQGVGGKVGLAILGAVPVEDLARVVTLEDKAMIARANGVGPRLAARIVTELKGKDLPGAGTELAAAAAVLAAPVASAASDAVSALENLGFRAPEAARAVAEAQRELGELATPALIREALKRASR